MRNRTATAPRPVPPRVLLSNAKQGSSELVSDGVLAHEVLAARPVVGGVERIR
jgi:hypothetical protein